MHTSSHNDWIKIAGLKVLTEGEKQEKIEVLEMDELIHTFKRERRTRVWTAVDRGKLRITAFEVGGRKSSVLRKLINKIGENNLKTVCTDGNFCYEEDMHECRYKVHIEQIRNLLSGESFNSVLRYYLARLHRRTKSYSKSLQMLELSVALLLKRETLCC